MNPLRRAMGQFRDEKKLRERVVLANDLLRQPALHDGNELREKPGLRAIGSTPAVVRGEILVENHLGDAESDFLHSHVP